jgi:hypothetical protein
LTHIVNGTLRRAAELGLEPEGRSFLERSLKAAAAGKYYAACGQAHGLENYWFGPCRGTAQAARADAQAHNASFTPPHHAGVLGPTICTDPDA